MNITLANIEAGVKFHTSRMTSPSGACDCGGTFKRTIDGVIMLRNCCGTPMDGNFTVKELEPETLVRDFKELIS